MDFIFRDLAHDVQQVWQLQEASGIWINLDCQILQKKPSPIKVPTKFVYLQLILCWVEAELPEDVSQQSCLHLTRGRAVKLFERLLKSSVFDPSSELGCQQPDIQISVSH